MKGSTQPPVNCFFFCERYRFFKFSSSGTPSYLIPLSMEGHKWKIYIRIQSKIYKSEISQRMLKEQYINIYMLPSIK